MARPIRATISLEALRHNYGVARHTAKGSRVLAVVKANAYGHGIDRAAAALRDADGFGVIELEGALRLRESGITREVLLLEGFFEARELPVLAAAGIATAVHSEEQLRMLHAAPPNPPLGVYLKINTGMNRLGFAPAKARSALARLQESGAAKSITLMTHFATADGPEGIEEALKRFNGATEGRSEERRVGKECRIRCRSRWSPYH